MILSIHFYGLKSAKSKTIRVNNYRLLHHQSFFLDLNCTASLLAITRVTGHEKESEERKISITTH